MNTQSAFETLLTPLRQAIKDAQEQGKQAFEQDRFGEAAEFSKRCQELQAQIKSLEEMQGKWREVVSAEPPVKHPLPPPRQRAPRGAKTPEAAYRMPILQALVEMGGRASATQVLDRVGEILQPVLNEIDRQILTNGRAIRWRNAAQWARHRMVEEDLVRLETSNGSWEITAQGRQAFMDGTAAVPAPVPARTRPKPGRAPRPIKTRPVKRTRAPRGESMPYATYRQYILLSLDDLVGRAPTRQVLERIESYLKPRFKEIDYQPLSDGSPRWQVAARFERKNMVINGLLRDDSPHGIWELSEAGREEVKKYRG